MIHRCVTSQDYYGGYFADNQDNNNEEGADENAEQEAQAYGNSYYNNEQRKTNEDAADDNEYNGDNNNEEGADLNAEQEAQVNEEGVNENSEQEAQVNEEGVNENAEQEAQANEEGVDENVEQEAQAYGNSYYNNEQRNDYEGMYYQKLVHFKLCPSNSCWQCKNGADYVVELNDYVDAVLEAQMTAKEYNCEHVRENCYCGSASSEEECLAGCYSNAALTYCVEAEENAFDLQKAVECMDLEVDKDKLAEFYNTQAGNTYYAEAGGQNNNQVDKLFAGPCEYLLAACWYFAFFSILPHI